jgi:hypothetical protein
MTNVIMLIVAAYLIAIGAARIAYNVSSDPGDGPVNVAWSQDSMEFVTWNNGKWTAWIHDGSFELSPQDSGKWTRHANGSIAFTSWDGEPWQAKIDGDSFILAYHGNWQGDVERSDAIRYRDWSGNNQLRTVNELTR